MYSRIDSDPEYHRQQLALAVEKLFREAEADRKHREYIQNRPGARLMNAIYTTFHSIDLPLASEPELKFMAQLNDQEEGAA